jgi:hypothetical protein
MKQLNIKIKLMLVSLLMLSVLSGCKKEAEVPGIGVVDMNSKITEFDKLIAQPGDTITFKGSNLDQVYKIMLNEENVVVKYRATATELKMAVPASAPLGSAITINILFSGKGLAQRMVTIQSPPVILELSPAAAHAGDVLTVLGKELYKSTQVFIGNVDVTASFRLIDDKQFTVTVPTAFAGGSVKIVTATGGETLSPNNLVLGTEILINNFDGKANFFGSISSNGNLDLDTEETGDFPRSKFYTFTFKDNATSWGGNVDFFTTGLPAHAMAITTLSIDIKVSKAMNVSVMVQNPTNVYGLTKSLVVGWQTIVIPFPDMGEGYGNGAPFGNVGPLNAITAVKIQPPAGASSGNFGETISMDNIKFIIAN